MSDSSSVAAAAADDEKITRQTDINARHSGDDCQSCISFIFNTENNSILGMNRPYEILVVCLSLEELNS